jgi:hypothetical protein
MVKDWLLYSAENYGIAIPGLSLTDGVEQEEKPSSHAFVQALAVEKIKALTLQCQQEKIDIPDYNMFFFKNITAGQEQNAEAETAGDEREFSDDGEGDDDEDEDVDDEEGVASGSSRPPMKKAKQ